MSPVGPKYQQIADGLRGRIREGELAPGDRLPAESALAVDHRTSVATVRQAIAMLRAEGVVESRHGIGTFVRQERQRVKRTPARYQWEKDRVALDDAARRSEGASEFDTGLSNGALNFAAEYIETPATGSIATAFGVAPGTALLQRVYRTRAVDETSPLSLSHSYLLYDVAAQNPALLDANNEPWPGGTQHQLSTLGIEVSRIEDHITARPPLPDEVEALDLGPGVAVLVLRKVSMAADGQVVEVADVVMPGDRTELVYPVELRPWEDV